MKHILNELVPVLLVVAFAGCASGRRLSLVEKEGITAQVAAGSIDDVPRMQVKEDTVKVVETIEVKGVYGNMITMNAVKDEESGEMVATDKLDEIVVVAKFRHVAERNGEVDLVFELSVPMELQQKEWQVRFSPHYHIMGDTLRTDKIYITGERFRKIQNWEHYMYDNYLRKIVPVDMADSVYTRRRLLERFNARTGNTMEPEAEKYFRKRVQERINENMAAASNEIYNRFVVDPFPGGGVRLDSVVYDKTINGIRYYYVQTIKTMPGLKKVEMVMHGEVYTNGRRLCALEPTMPVTFYISSMSAFADNTERYLKKVVYRDLHLTTSYNIEFRKGKWDIDPNFSLNGKELSAMRENIGEILENEEFVMDSIHIAASGSPDGKLQVNERISRLRGVSIKEYVSKYVQSYKDSLKKSMWEINEDENYREENKVMEKGFGEDNIKVVSVPEDWEGLYSLVEKDTLVVGRGGVMALWIIEDLDAREVALRRLEGFRYIEENIYPKLRRVQFNFMLHRKGMIKDTVHTTQLDSVYMRGVEALKERDYKLAVTLLRPYACYNTAVAYVCMDYNKSALDILLKLPADARRDYMLAVVYSRLGDERQALQHFLSSVEQDEAMRLRGNLDPEISALIKRYGIFPNN